MDEERSFDDRETALILSRAAELGRPRTGADSVDRRGITLEELERIAGEAGIAPELVREAAAEIASRGGRRSFARALLGGATKRTLAFEVPGRADKATLERVLLELPRAAGTTGTGFVSPDGLTWSSGVEAARGTGDLLSVEIRVQEQCTTVEIADHRGGAAGVIFGGIAGGFGMGAGLPVAAAVGPQTLGLGPWGALLGLVPVAAAWLACRTGFSAFTKKRDVRLERLRSDLKLILRRREAPREPEPAED